MIDSTKWLEEYRSKDKTNWSSFDYECEYEELEEIRSDADKLGMTPSEYVAYALDSLVESEGMHRCGTCKRIRPDFSQPCRYCGEID